MNQNEILVSKELSGIKGLHLFGVLDGHGLNGGKISKYLRNAVNETAQMLIYRKQTNDLREMMRSILRQASDKLPVQNLYRIDPNKFDCSVSGAVALLAFVHGCRLFIANLGNARAILVTKYAGVRQLSNDHKTTSSREQERVAQEGGLIENDYKTGLLHPVLWDDTHEKNIDITRSIGDLAMKRASRGMSDEPEISEYELTENDSALVLGTHAIWRHLSNDKVATIMAEYHG